MGTVTKNMKIFLVTVVLSLTILGQAWGAPGQHLLIETEDGEDSSDSYEEGDVIPDVGAGSDEIPAVGAGGIRRGPRRGWWGGGAASNSNAANRNNIQIG